MGVTPRELLTALRKIEESGKLETAKRAKIKAGQVFRYAVLEGKAESDPTASVRGALKVPKSEHHAARRTRPAWASCSGRSTALLASPSHSPR